MNGSAVGLATRRLDVLQLDPGLGWLNFLRDHLGGYVGHTCDPQTFFLGELGSWLLLIWFSLWQPVLCKKKLLQIR